jgi:hypothetical protein
MWYAGGCMNAMNRSGSILVACSIALASRVAALAFFVGVATASPETVPSPQPFAAVEVVAFVIVPQCETAISAAHEVLAVRRFPHDKRQPRPPRHRSERASSYNSDLERAASVIDSIIHDVLHRPLLVAAVALHPLSGHPLELLRPPSLCA